MSNWSTLYGGVGKRASLKDLCVIVSQPAEAKAIETVDKTLIAGVGFLIDGRYAIGLCADQRDLVLGGNV